jgi:polysaccharide export outer membrane protein
MSRRLWTLACLGLSLVVGACNTDAPEFGAPVPIAQLEAARIPPVRTSAGPYVLGLNDLVRVKAYNEPEITGEYVVDSAGFVAIPLAGRVRAAGLTAPQLERAIMSRLDSGIIRDPRVTVEISTYTPFYIQGEVKRGGEFAYRPGLMVIDAVAGAGGFTYRANEKKVYIRRAGASFEELYPLDAPVPVHPGDNIRIPERYF